MRKQYLKYLIVKLDNLKNIKPMSLKKYVLLYHRLEQLIKMEATGNPNELAEKLDISTRQLFNYLSDLKELGLPITFNSQKNSYVFQKQKELF
jgi:hypothetical protein